MLKRKAEGATYADIQNERTERKRVLEKLHKTNKTDGTANTQE